MFEESLLQACFNILWHFDLCVLKLHQLKAGVGGTPEKTDSPKSLEFGKNLSVILACRNRKRKRKLESSKQKGTSLVPVGDRCENNKKTDQSGKSNAQFLIDSHLMEQGERISFTNVQWLLLVHKQSYLGKSNIFPPKKTLRPSVPIMQHSPLLNGSAGLILLPKELPRHNSHQITPLSRPILQTTTTTLPIQHTDTDALFFPSLCISCMAIITGQPLKIEPWMNQRPECFLYACLYPAPALCSVKRVFERQSSWHSRDSSQQTRRGITEGRETGFVFEVNKTSSVEAGCQQ